MAATGEMQGAGRTVRLPRLARRKQLLAAAQEVFVAQGYHAAAMDDTADRAGVSKPVLYQHFPGKLELYLALLDTHCEVLIGNIRSVRAYYGCVDHDSKAFRLIFESDLRNDPSVRERVDRAQKACIDAITETIMVDTGVPRAPAELLAAGLVGAAAASAQFWLAGGLRIERDGEAAQPQIGPAVRATRKGTGAIG
jgi:AcrR family transcriptional regulator